MARRGCARTRPTPITSWCWQHCQQTATQGSGRLCGSGSLAYPQQPRSSSAILSRRPRFACNSAPAAFSRHRRQYTNHAAHTSAHPGTHPVRPPTRARPRHSVRPNHGVRATAKRQLTPSGSAASIRTRSAKARRPVAGRPNHGGSFAQLLPRRELKHRVRRAPCSLRQEALVQSGWHHALPHGAGAFFDHQQTCAAQHPVAVAGVPGWPALVCAVCAGRRCRTHSCVWSTALACTRRAGCAASGWVSARPCCAPSSSAPPTSAHAARPRMPCAQRLGCKSPSLHLRVINMSPVPEHPSVRLAFASAVSSPPQRKFRLLHEVDLTGIYVPVPAAAALLLPTGTRGIGPAPLLRKHRRRPGDRHNVNDGAHRFCEGQAHGSTVQRMCLPLPRQPPTQTTANEVRGRGSTIEQLMGSRAHT